MSDYIIINGELYHYGVKGMKWGVVRNRRRAAKAAGDAAFKKSISDSKASPNSHKIGSGRTAIRNANKARREAYNKTMYDSASRRQKAKIDRSGNPDSASKIYKDDNKKANKEIVYGTVAKTVSNVLNRSGKILYNQIKDNASSTGVAVVRGLGYTAKALDVIGGMAIAKGGIDKVAARYRYADNYIRENRR